MASDALLRDSPSSNVSQPVNGAATRDSTFSRSACGECQRRKQKCDRGWPCNHCQKRKVAEKCNYRGKVAFAKSSTQSSINDQESEATENATKAKRRPSPEGPVETYDDETPDSDSNFDSDNENNREDLEALGYTASHHLFSLAQFSDELTPGKTKKRRRRQIAYKLGPPQTYMDASTCPQLQRALQVLPPRPYADALVQNFLKNVNFHYYIIYPQGFVEEYLAWWNDRADNRPLGLQWTCLLMMVCACSAQYTDAELQQKLENDLSETTQVLTERYHEAARELHSVIPISTSHLLNVQQLLHSCYWYKSEVRFVECWHVLSSAIREAQELGMHQEANSGNMPEFEREMRRRIWCVLDTWDWQISALLSRPMLINRADCDVKLPSLSLEGYAPSPLLHMKLQSELIGRLARRFGSPKNVVNPSDVEEYKDMLEGWIGTFPPTYELEAPDKSQDTTRPWIKLHRHYLHTMAISMTLDPIRTYLTTETSKESALEVVRIRDCGVDYALKLMDILHGFFDHVWPRDAKFHFVLFAIFDTASVLCSAIIHDLDNTLPREAEMLDAVRDAVSMLRRLQELLPSAKVSYNLLVRFWKKAKKLSARGRAASKGARSQRKRIKVAEIIPTPHDSGVSAEASTVDNDAFGGIEQGVEYQPSSEQLNTSSNFTSLALSTDTNASNGAPRILNDLVAQDKDSTVHDLSISSSYPTKTADLSEAPAPFPPYRTGVSNPATGLIQSPSSSLGIGNPDLYLNQASINPPWPNTHPRGIGIDYTFSEELFVGPQITSTSSGYQYAESLLNQRQPAEQSFSRGFQPPMSGEYVDGADDINFDLSTIMENEAGSLGQLWNWKGLDLEFLPVCDQEKPRQP